MKKIILLIAISFSLAGFQSCNNDDKKENEKDVSAANVPDPVKSAFSSKYASAADVKWEDAHEDNKQTYKAKFKLNGKKMKAEFDSTGTLIKEKEDD